MRVTTSGIVTGFCGLPFGGPYRLVLRDTVNRCLTVSLSSTWTVVCCSVPKFTKRSPTAAVVALAVPEGSEVPSPLIAETR